MNSFLYNWHLRHERVGKKPKSQNILIHLPGSVLQKKKKNEFWKNSQNNRMKSIIVDNFCRQFCRATSSNRAK